jgi:hypothetical protein
MRFSTVVASVATCSIVTLAVPIEQQPLTGIGRHAGPRAHSPYSPGYKNPYDKKIDAVGDKLHPLPYVGSL